MYSVWRLDSAGPVLLCEINGMRLYCPPNLKKSNMNPQPTRNMDAGNTASREVISKKKCDPHTDYSNRKYFSALLSPRGEIGQFPPVENSATPTKMKNQTGRYNPLNAQEWEISHISKGFSQVVMRRAEWIYATKESARPP